MSRRVRSGWVTQVAALCAGDAAPPVLKPATTKRVFVIADSQGCGRGAGGGVLFMDNARQFAWPSFMRDRLVALGYNAFAETWADAQNSSSGLADLPAYDPRCVIGAATSSGVSAGGKLGRSNIGAGFQFTPAVPVKKIDVWVPILTTGTGTQTVDLDGGTPSANFINNTATQGGVARMKKITLTDGVVGTHTARINYVSGAGSAVFGTFEAYDDTNPFVSIINMSARETATTFWVDASNAAYSPLTCQAGYGANVTIISLGWNNGKSGGTSSTTIEVFQADLHTLITTAQANGSQVILIVPPDINPTSYGPDGRPLGFNLAQLQAAYAAEAALCSVPVFDFQNAITSWTVQNGLGNTVDNFHYKAAAYQLMGAYAADVSLPYL